MEPRIVMWNVDTQYDFMRDDAEYHGTLVVPGAHLIEVRLAEITALAEKYDVKVINTADSHSPASEEISANPDYRITFPAHCLTGTRGAEYIPATNPVNPLVIDWRGQNASEAVLREYRNVVLTKDAFDVFKGKPWSPHAEELLDIVKPEIAVVYGVATNVCVDYAVSGLLQRHIKVFVPTDAIKELPGTDLEAVLGKWKDAGATLISSQNIEPMLRERYGVR